MDPQFRYFALNSIMRWDAKTRSRIFAKKKPADGAMTVGINKYILMPNLILGELRDLLAEDVNRIADQIAYFGANI